MTDEEFMQELSWQTQAIENHNRAEAAEALALELADSLEDAKSWVGECYDVFAAEWMKFAIHDDVDETRMGLINSALLDERLAKLREKKND